MIRIILIREMVMIREDKNGNEARTRSKTSKKRPFNLCIQRLDHFDDAHYINLFNLCFKTNLEAGAKIRSLFTMFTHPMTYWYIRQKYIFQPLLLLQSLPCHHIASERFFQPIRQQKHASKVSRQNSRFVPQETASLLKSLRNLCCFPQ